MSLPRRWHPRQSGGIPVREIASVINEPLSLPGWFDTVVILLLAAGFPIAIVFAWAFEITPEGIRREEKTAEPRPSRSLAQGRAIDFAIIAVLRFVNETDDPEQNYLSNGIPNEILNRLIPVEGLVVAGENSSFQFDIGTGQYTDIGRALDVSYVLEGSFLKIGERIRVRPRLVQTSDGVAVWNERSRNSRARPKSIRPMPCRGPGCRIPMDCWCSVPALKPKPTRTTPKWKVPQAARSLSGLRSGIRITRWLGHCSANPTGSAPTTPISGPSIWYEAAARE